MVELPTGCTSSSCQTTVGSGLSGPASVALDSAGDVFIGYSTSGRSPNILAALDTARAMGLVTIGFTGNRGGPMVGLCDHLLAVPSADTPKIQEGHLVLGHILCGLIESTLFPRD